MELSNLFQSKKELQLKLDKKNIEIIKNSPLFDEIWYLQQNKDVAKSGMDAAEHYYFYGGFERRDPSIFFSSDAYYKYNSDVLFNQMNPLLHYEIYGRKEHRIAIPSYHQDTSNQIHIDGALSSDNYKDLVDQAFIKHKYKLDFTSLNQFKYYISLKDNLLTAPSLLFDPKWYVENYLDIKMNGVNPFIHYCENGIYENRLPRNPKNLISTKLFFESKSNFKFDQFYIKQFAPCFPNENALLKIIEQYDVLSFDIFDTALVRNVTNLVDVFELLRIRTNISNFKELRTKAEQIARQLHYKKFFNREISLAEIYDVMSNNFGVDHSIMDLELDTEQQILRKNPYIYRIYKLAQEKGKKIIFTTDMYLPMEFIQLVLHKEGYDQYEKIYLSNELQASKETTTIQDYILNDYVDYKIIHIGDNPISDQQLMIKKGIKGIAIPQNKLFYKFAYQNNLPSSFARCILAYEIPKLENQSIHYIHGFMNGGFLTIGYLNFIEKIVKEHSINKILFCARDCDIVYKIYQKHFNTIPNSYIAISRLAIMSAFPKRFAHDLLNRFVFKYWEENKNAITLNQLLQDLGYDYLIEKLEDYDLDGFIFLRNIPKSEFELFFLDHINTIELHNKENTTNAIQYFKEIVGNAKKILVVDIGWSGTCITALQDLLKAYINPNIEVLGSLLASSDQTNVANQKANNSLFTYLCSPDHNQDLLKFFHPSQKSIKEKDLIHMPLEYLFTSTDPSLISYKYDQAKTDAKGKNYKFTYSNYVPTNSNQIEDMQQGILHFAHCWFANTSFLNLTKPLQISPYSAFEPLKKVITDPYLNCYIYKDFIYDSIPNVTNIYYKDLFDFSIVQDQARALELESTETTVSNNNNETQAKEKILFVSHDFESQGSPRSLLRTVRVAIQLGYEPIVWSLKDGIMRSRFENELKVKNIEIVSNNLTKAQIATAKACKLAYLNTVVTFNLVAQLQNVLPVVWFIREASNIIDFFNRNPNMHDCFLSFDNIYCVSNYAAKALAKYTHQPIHVLNNCVEDETFMATDYQVGSSKKIRFCQFGTIEYRKGYDLFLSAFLTLPKEYQDQAELYFAGTFINSNSEFASLLFSKIKNHPNIHYLGFIKTEEEKIKTLSSMDVIVVASRDESCSLVALEGAMLSKPLIVSSNVGAKYLVSYRNGLIFNSDDVESLRNCYIRMIEARLDLNKMGQHSRRVYEKKASMESHTKDLANLFNLNFNDQIMIPKRNNKRVLTTSSSNSSNQEFKPKIIVSLTSYPPRIKYVATTIKSLLNQTYDNYEINLWLSRDEFPNEINDLNNELKYLNDQETKLNIHFVDHNIKSHKKYLYAMQQFAHDPIIIVDDDVIYDPSLIQDLVDSYEKHPNCISANRVNLIRFTQNGQFRKYIHWQMDYTILKDQPSLRLLPTGIGGVLYPPHAIDLSYCTIDNIMENCPNVDDLWLKMLAVANNVPTVLISNNRVPKIIENSQETSLWQTNVMQDQNDHQLQKILDFLKAQGIDIEKLKQTMRNDYFAIEF